MTTYTLVIVDNKGKLNKHHEVTDHYVHDGRLIIQSDENESIPLDEFLHAYIEK